MVVEFTTGDVVSQSTAVANIDKLPHVTSVANPPVVEDAGRISRWKDSDHQRPHRSRTLLLGYDAAVRHRSGSPLGMGAGYLRERVGSAAQRRVAFSVKPKTGCPATP